MRSTENIAYFGSALGSRLNLGLRAGRRQPVVSHGQQRVKQRQSREHDRQIAQDRRHARGNVPQVSTPDDVSAVASASVQGMRFLRIRRLWLVRADADGRFFLGIVGEDVGVAAPVRARFRSAGPLPFRQSVRPRMSRKNSIGMVWSDLLSSAVYICCSSETCSSTPRGTALCAWRYRLPQTPGPRA